MFSQCHPYLQENVSEVAWGNDGDISWPIWGASWTVYRKQIQNFVIFHIVTGPIFDVLGSHLGAIWDTIWADFCLEVVVRDNSTGAPKGFEWDIEV